MASLYRRCADDVPRGAREGEDAVSILRFERTSLPKAVSSPDMIGLRVIGQGREIAILISHAHFIAFMWRLDCCVSACVIAVESIETTRQPRTPCTVYTPSIVRRSGRWTKVRILARHDFLRPRRSSVSRPKKSFNGGKIRIRDPFLQAPGM